MAVVVSIPKGVLNGILSSRAADGVCSAVEEAKDVVKRGRNNALLDQVRRGGELGCDGFVVHLEAVVVPSDVADNFGKVVVVHPVEHSVEDLGKLCVISAPNIPVSQVVESSRVVQAVAEVEKGIFSIDIAVASALDFETSWYLQFLHERADVVLAKSKELPALVRLEGVDASVAVGPVDWGLGGPDGVPHVSCPQNKCGYERGE